MNKKIIISVFILVFFFGFLLNPNHFLAQSKQIPPEVEYPEILGIKPKSGETSLPEYLKYIFNFSIFITGLILLISLVSGGIKYVISAGDVGKKGEAKEQINSAFLGALFLFFGYLILTTINPELLVFELPSLSRETACNSNSDCPRGYSCKEKEGKKECVMNVFCQVNEDCPYTYKCENGVCTKQKEENVQIFWEIPVGQMLQKALWNKENIQQLKNLTLGLQSFLNPQPRGSNEAMAAKEDEPLTISDWARKLKTLSDSCFCANTTAICQKAQNFAFPQDCEGDPCVLVRSQINQVLSTLREKSTELLAYKKKFAELSNIIENEGRKQRLLMEKITEDCKGSGLISRKEYYDLVAQIQSQGGKTELQRLYLPAEDDPFVFYCSVGGSIYDTPYLPPQDFPRLPESPSETHTTPPAQTPLSCPIIIPVGTIAQDLIEDASFSTNKDLEDLSYYIDKLIELITDLNELVSQCNDSRCTPVCSCIPNPCFGKLICGPFGNSPCLQTIGVCSGEPCPREDLAEKIELIKIYEDEILKILEKISFNENYVNNTLMENLGVMRLLINYCLALGPKTAVTQMPEEGIFWQLLRCEYAIGQKGPDNNIITECNPNDLFCCTTAPTTEEIEKFSSFGKINPDISVMPKGEEKEKRETYSPTVQGTVYSPTLNLDVKFPYFSQKDLRWRNKSFGCEGVSNHTTIGQAGCGPTALAMALSYLGIPTDPPTMADWVLKKGYRVCGAGTAHAACCAAVKEFDKENKFRCQPVSGGSLKDELATLLEKPGIALIEVSGRGPPPYTKGGHYILITNVEKKWDEIFVYYNDPAYDPINPASRPPRGNKPIDWFEKEVKIGGGCIIYK